MPTIQPMNSSILHRVAAVVGVVAMLLWGVPAGAYADPPDAAPGGAVIDAPTLSLGDLGEGQTLTFDGAADTTSTELSFPVPLGLAPLALIATLAPGDPCAGNGATRRRTQHGTKRFGIRQGK